MVQALDRLIIPESIMVNFDHPQDFTRVSRIQRSISERLPTPGLKLGQGLVFMAGFKQLHHRARVTSSTMLDMRGSGNPDLMDHLVESARVHGFAATTVATQIGCAGLELAAWRQNGIKIVPVILHDTVNSDVANIKAVNKGLDQSHQIQQVLCDAVDVDKAVGLGLSVIVSGIRLAGQPQDDHEVVLTPAEARSAGADKLSIGRPITLADDPGEVCLQALENMASVA